MAKKHVFTRHMSHDIPKHPYASPISARQQSLSGSLEHEDIEAELHVAEVLHRAPPHPCECCTLTREEVAKIWAIVNIFISIYDIYATIAKLIVTDRSHTTGQKHESFDCEIHATALSVASSSINFFFALVYFIASVGFFVAMLFLKKKPIRLRLITAYQYTCVFFSPAFGHIIAFVNNLYQCWQHWEYEIIYIITIAILIFASWFGFMVARAYISWLNTPVIREVEDLAVQARRSRMDPSSARFNRRRSNSLVGRRRSRSNSMVSERSARRMSLASSSGRRMSLALETRSKSQSDLNRQRERGKI